MKEPSLLVEVRTFLEREHLHGRPVLVAVSGGPDSMALLDALHALAQQADLRVAAGHVNHQLRGAESDADQTFVTEFCQQWQIELHLGRIDVRQTAEDSGENLESTARRLRYDWLTQTALSIGCTWLTTGHTADDQAETVLHHILRGTGLRGLRGIARRRPLTNGIELIRPLLSVTRVQVLEYLQARQLTTRLDSSNLDLTLTRNRIRHELLPLLASEFNPRITPGLSRLADQAQALWNVQEQFNCQLLKEVEKPRAGDVVVLDAERLAQAGWHQARELFHHLWEREGWPLGEMDHAHWTRLAELAFGENTAVDLPGGVRAQRKGRMVQLWQPGERGA